MHVQANPGRQVRAVAAVRSEINVTPLVDVCLVLLIIFIMVAPLLRRGIDVDLPRTSSLRSMPDAQLTLSIRSDGNVFVDRVQVPRERLAATLAASHAQVPGRPVVVDGDRLLPYQEVASVLQMVRDAGFDRVGLATERRQPN
jgi:biopolymer transport protein TolR